MSVHGEGREEVGDEMRKGVSRARFVVSVFLKINNVASLVTRQPEDANLPDIPKPAWDKLDILLGFPIQDRSSKSPHSARSFSSPNTL
jgi:hypothetical protein